MDEKKQVSEEIISVGEIVIEIIKADLTGGDYTLPVNCDFKKLFKLSENHKVTSLVADAVLKSENASEAAKQVFKRELFKNSMRYEAQNKERNELSKLFSENGIEFCFLKGEKVSKYYNEPEKRYTLDMDVYVSKEKAELAEKLIKERGYELNTFGDEKDVGYIKKPFLNIEIHRELKYDYDKGYEYYKGAFQRLLKKENTCEFYMSNEDFYVYILSHSAHHIENGGTGIRNILDHYYMKEKLLPQCDEKVLEKALKDIGLYRFNERLSELCDCWFSEKDMTDSVKELSDFIILSGVFGNRINSYMSEVLRGQSSGNKVIYYLKRLFPPYAQMKCRYKILVKLPLLLPLFWGVRLITFTASGGKATAEIDAVNSVGNEEKQRFTEFMRKNGL